MRELKQYSREFKIEALRLLETSGKSAAQLERELDIGSGNLSRWRRKMAEDGEDAFPGHGSRTREQEEIRQLKQQVKVLTQERDISKKAIAIFSERKP
jgi:transposase